MQHLWRSDRMRASSGAHAAALAMLLLGGGGGREAAADWVAGPSFPAGPDARAWGAGLRVGERLYVIGGTPFEVGGDANAAVHVLNDPDGSWAALPTVEGAIIRQAAGVDQLGRIIVVGGENGLDPEADTGQAFVYDDDEGQWNQIADRGPLAPASHFAWASDEAGALHLIGGGPGAGASGGDPNIGLVQWYDAITDQWNTGPSLPAGRADAAAVFDAGGRLLVIGGIDAGATMRLTSVLVLEPGAGTWDAAAIPPLPVALSDHRAVRGPDDRIHVIGGVSGPLGAGTIEAAIWILDADGLAWTSGPAMAVARTGFAAMAGPDEGIWACGGITPAGPTTAVERLFAPACATVLTPPGDRAAWSGGTLVLTADFTASTPLTYGWEIDGAPVVDGPAGGGGTISGADSPTLVISGVGLADAGGYVALATNACGTTAAAAATVTVRATPAIPRTWTATSLHPSGALASVAYGTDGERQFGSQSLAHPVYGALEHPVIWTGGAGSFVDLTPAGSVGGAVADGNADMQVGWYWWPYGCGQGQTCYDRHGASWLGSAASHEPMHASGWEYSRVSDLDDGIAIGTISGDDAVGNPFSEAVLFHGGFSYTTLRRPGYARAGGSAADSGRFYGSAVTPTPGPTVDAVMWPAIDADPVRLRPSGAGRSWITAAGDGQQVGTAAFNDVLRPCLWTDSPIGVVQLAEAGGNVSDCAGGLQVGAMGGTAVVWNGSADGWFDLGATLPEGYGSSQANAIHVADDGLVTVAGSAWYIAAARTEAVMWRSVPGGPAADINGDGVVDLADLLSVLAAWGPCSGCPQDLDGDGVVGFGDLLAVIAGWDG